MRKNHNFEAAYDFQIQSSFDNVTNYLNAHYSTLLISNKKLKLREVPWGVSNFSAKSIRKRLVMANA